jgi:hypothetical protein
MLNLEIPSIIYEPIGAQVQTEAPIESCGISVGSEGRVEEQILINLLLSYC